MKYIDYYQVLGLQNDADLDDIKRAYRKLLRNNHPELLKDKTSENQLNEFAEAYTNLKDPKKREAFDALGLRDNGSDFFPSIKWSKTFSDGSLSFDEMSLTDMLAAIQSKRCHPAYITLSKNGKNDNVTVAISMLDSLIGTHLSLQLIDQGISRELDVKIPAGVRQGQKIQMVGLGSRGVHGGNNGDLYLKVKLKPNKLFRASGSDLYMDLALTPWECVNGIQIEIPTLQESVYLTIPPGTRNGQKLKLKGRGLPISKTKRGDLLAVVYVKVSPEISTEELQPYRQISKLSNLNRCQSLGKKSNHLELCND